MENKFPKNVRQIGNVSDTPKIYVEDYVDTFLNQICDKADKEQAGAFLVGKKEVTEGQECLYIFGAICMEFSGDENEIISQENFEKAEQEKKEYFFFPGGNFGLDKHPDDPVANLAEVFTDGIDRRPYPAGELQFFGNQPQRFDTTNKQGHHHRSGGDGDVVVQLAHRFGKRPAVGTDHHEVVQ